MIYEGKCTVIGIIITGKIMLAVCYTGAAFLFNAKSAISK